jgi:hypothetical protein
MEHMACKFDSFEAVEVAVIEADLAMAQAHLVAIVLALRPRSTRIRISKDLRKFNELLNAKGP